MSRVLAVTLGGLLAVSCADRRGAPASADTPSDPAASAAAGAPDPEGASEVQPERVAAAPSVSPDDAPAPTPPAAPPALPDGTVIAACTESPPKMACVQGGAFVRGADDGAAHARPRATVHLQTFYMDVFEVTYAEYGECMADEKCPRARPRYLDFDHPNIPMTGVSWFDAQAYCEAHGKTLPTEAQWEKAARGPDGHLYPWGDDPVTCEHAIIQDASGRSCGRKKEKSKPETGRPWDVGSRPAGAYGLHDMVGNSWEWTADWYAPSFEKCGEACEGIDPEGPCGGAAECRGHARKVLRGGSWYWPAEMATGTYRRAHVPDNEPFHHFGFRCAATVEQARALTEAQG